MLLLFKYKRYGLIGTDRSFKEVIDYIHFVEYLSITGSDLSV